MKKQILNRLRNLSLKNKMFLSHLAVIFTLSLGIALLARWLLISSLTLQLKERGTGIAQSVAEASRRYILTEDIPELTGIVFDSAQLKGREILIAYIFIVDTDGGVLAHTFVQPFPHGLAGVNPIPEGKPAAIMLHRTGGESVYDVATPVHEGIYQIGTVHVGLSKKRIDHLIDKLRTTFLGFLTGITILIFGMSHRLSRKVTRQMTELARVSDEISRGNLDIQPEINPEVRCWQIKSCEKTECPAHENTRLPCWYIDGTLCSLCASGQFPEKLKFCYRCEVYDKTAGDEAIQFYRSFWNMTLRLRSSEAELRESEKKYRSMFNSGPDPIFVLDAVSLEILDANPSAEATYGYTREELMGNPFTDLGPVELNMEAALPEKDAWPKACTIGQKVRHFKKDGRPFYVNLNACPTRYGERNAMIVAITDITEMLEKDAQLIQSSKMTSLGEMSAGIAHELNQPLNAIKIGSEYIRMMIEQGARIPEPDLAQVNREIIEQVDRAAEIISRLKDFSRKADFTLEKVDVNRAMRNVLDIVGQQLMLQNIEVKIELEERLPAIRAHNNRLEQVIFNLVTNARDAIRQKHDTGKSAEEQMITLATRREAGRVVLSVSDTGIGIPEENRDKIFEPFFTTKEVGKGMGLGLSIIYGIVKDYRGTVEVSSEEGMGTTFRCLFPVA